MTFGNIANRLNHYQDAASAYQRALKLNPNLTDAYFELAQAQAALGLFLEAQKNYRSYLLMRPDSGKGYQAFANLLQRWGRLVEATENYQKAVELISDDPELHLQLGALLQQQGLFDEAMAQYEKAQQLNPELASTYNHMAMLFRDTDQTDLALVNFKKAFDLAPEQEASYEYYLGSVCDNQNDTDSALTHYETALQINNDLAEAHFSRALCLLKKGQFKQGWAEYEWRRRIPNWLKQRNHHVTNILLWKGEKLPESTILMIAEQGYGDIFQFSRYLPLLAKHFAKVVVRCKPEVARLLSLVDGVDEVILTTDEIATTRYHAYVHLMSLPYLFGTTLKTIPGNVPYLIAPAESKSQWHERIGNDGFKVGLVWSGSPQNSKNIARNIRLADLAPLGEIPGVRFFGLQKGPGSEQASIPPANMDFTDLGKIINDFSDTAAAISNLDLVISVETAVAHLAGALGKPVWTLPYFPTDWRWLEERDDSPWYPSMWLFHQDAKKDWSAVIERVVFELRSLMEAPIQKPALGQQTQSAEQSTHK